MRKCNIVDTVVNQATPPQSEMADLAVLYVLFSH